MVGIGTAEEDASNALLAVHFHEVGIFKGGGVVLGAVDTSLEWNAGRARRYCNGVGLAVGLAG